ncbi:hypothetical protein T484DRAFT_1784529, partial [Baffinella frigidus]
MKDAADKGGEQCAYECCPSRGGPSRGSARAREKDKWRVVTPDTTAGGRDWTALAGKTLCDSCYSTFRKHGTLVRSVRTPEGWTRSDLSADASDSAATPAGEGAAAGRSVGGQRAHLLLQHVDGLQHGDGAGVAAAFKSPGDSSDGEEAQQGGGEDFEEEPGGLGFFPEEGLPERAVASLEVMSAEGEARKSCRQCKRVRCTCGGSGERGDTPDATPEGMAAGPPEKRARDMEAAPPAAKRARNDHPSQMSSDALQQELRQRGLGTEGKWGVLSARLKASRKYGQCVSENANLLGGGPMDHGGAQALLGVTAGHGAGGASGLETGEGVMGTPASEGDGGTQGGASVVASFDGGGRRHPLLSSLGVGGAAGARGDPP